MMSVVVRVVTGLWPVKFFIVQNGKWTEVPGDKFDPNRTGGQKFANFCYEAVQRISLEMLESYARRPGVDRGAQAHYAIMSLDILLMISGFTCVEEDFFTGVIPPSLVDGAPGDFTLALVRGAS
jgi:hypothetical protein